MEGGGAVSPSNGIRGKNPENLALFDLFADHRPLFPPLHTVEHAIISDKNYCFAVRCILPSLSKFTTSILLPSSIFLIQSAKLMTREIRLNLFNSTDLGKKYLRITRLSEHKKYGMFYIEGKRNV